LQNVNNRQKKIGIYQNPKYENSLSDGDDRNDDIVPLVRGKDNYEIESSKNEDKSEVNNDKSEVNNNKSEADNFIEDIRHEKSTEESKEGSDDVDADSEANSDAVSADNSELSDKNEFTMSGEDWKKYNKWIKRKCKDILLDKNEILQRLAPTLGPKSENMTIENVSAASNNELVNWALDNNIDIPSLCYFFHVF